MRNKKQNRRFCNSTRKLSSSQGVSPIISLNSALCLGVEVLMESDIFGRCPWPRQI